MGNQPNTLWLQYLQAVEDVVAPKPQEALHVVYPYTLWDWGGQRPIPGSYSYDQWAALNVVPAEVGGNVNDRSMLSGFDVAYKSWFDALVVGDLGKDHKYKSLQRDVQKALKKWQRDLDKAKHEWQKETGSTAGSFEDWLAAPENQPTDQLLDNDKADYEAEEQQLSQYRTAASGPVAEIQSAYDDPSYAAYVTVPGSGNSIPLRLWTTDPAYAWNYVYAVTGNNFGGHAIKGTSGSLSLGSRSPQYAAEKAYGGSLQPGFFGDFFGAGATGRFRALDDTSLSPSYSLKMSWEDLKTITVKPAGWYQANSVAMYGAGEDYITGYAGFSEGKSIYFFGSGGALSRIYSSIAVVYRPTVTITAGAAFAKQLEEAWGSRSGIHIGPLFFSSDADSLWRASTASLNGGSFTVTSNDDWPLIMAYLSTWTLSPDK